MAETFKFPHGGNDVTIVRKQDILDCIDQNILDKDVALAVIEQCEIDIEQNLINGKWTGIPFLGSLKPKLMRKRVNADIQDTIKESKVQMDKSTYVLFRKNLVNDLARQEKYDRWAKYITSLAAGRYKNKYRMLCRTKGEAYAKAYMFLTNFIVAVENEEIYND